jgi:hypothetical protein
MRGVDLRTGVEVVERDRPGLLGGDRCRDDELVVATTVEGGAVAVLGCSM